MILDADQMLKEINRLAEFIYFEPGYSSIREDSYVALDPIANLLKYFQTPLRIEGRINVVNAKGRAQSLNSKKLIILEENCTWEQLSLRRAQKVADYLVSKDQSTGRCLLVSSASQSNEEPITLDPRSTDTNRFYRK